MPVYQLSEQPVFPSPEEALPEGLLAVGGDLAPQRLILAYTLGIFPWYSEPDPILWWSPDPRLVLEPERLKVSKSLRRVIAGKKFSVTMDRAFETVIRKCAGAKRKDQGTWIVPDMIDAYIELHHRGFAHSVEVWGKEALAGALYGVSVGKAFFGESMFSEKSNASKVALVYLAAALQAWGFSLIDCQVRTDHLVSMGAHEIPRRDFLQRLKKAVQEKTKVGVWQIPEDLELL